MDEKLTSFEGKTVKTIVEEYCSVTFTFTDGTFLKLEAEGYEGTHMELTYTQLIRRRSGE